MLDMILSPSNLDQALEYLLTKKDGCGIDGMPLSQLPEYLSMNRALLVESIRSSSYTPQTVILFDKLEKNGRQRTLARFSSLDRLILRAIYQCLYEKIVPTFSAHSYAFRRKVGTIDAVRSAVNMVSEGKTWMGELDIRRYFDQIPHDLLLTAIRQRIDDGALVSLIEKYLKNPILKDGDLMINQRGVIQGNPISPLLSNLYLDPLDKYCEEQAISYIRYADDIRIFEDSYTSCARKLQELKRFVTQQLSLDIAEEKSGVYPAIGRIILGYQLVQSPKGIEIRRYVRKKNRTSNTWTTRALQKKEDAYHIIGDGILSRKDYALLFENEEQKMYLPAETVHSLNIHADVFFSSRFFAFANEKELEVNIFNSYGVYQGSFLPAKAHVSAEVAILQLRAYDNLEKRLYLAKNIIVAGLHNLRTNIRYYKNRLQRKQLDKAIETITGSIEEIQNAGSVEKIMLAEAKAREQYYAAINDMLPEDGFPYIRRSRRPPKDPINSLISFGNVFLYNEIAKEIYKTPLDIRIAFLHSAGKRHQSLNLDIAEIYKPIVVDRVIFSLINHRILSEREHFQTEENGAVFLTKEGKRIYLERLRDKLYTTLKVNGKHLTYAQLINRDLYGLINHLRNGKEFRPYRAY